MLFRKSSAAKPQLQQTEREAIVDLLHLCLYADSHIALKEGEFLADVVNVIGWEPQSTIEIYEQSSIAKARAAKEDPAEKRVFFAGVAKRLPSRAIRDLALDLCKQLLAADGTVDKEAVVLAEIRAALR